MNHAIEWESLPPGSHRQSCPACGRGKRDKTLGVTVDFTGNGVAHCFRCTFVETYRPQQPERQQHHIHRQPVQPVAVETPQQHETLSAPGRALWQAAHPIRTGTPAGHYLTMRRCALPPVNGHLRWLPAHRHPTGHVGPCLVALLTDAETRQPRSLHFTWFNGGRKADVTPPRLLLRGHRKAGAVCRLWPDEFVTHGLGIAEGIETALSLAHGFAPVWACIDAGNLAGFPVLPGIGTLVIGQDRDPAGEKAARACAERWATAGAEVLTTRQHTNDLNDLVQEVAA